jgi:hypothetical protein
MLQQVIEIVELLDDPNVNGAAVGEFFARRGLEDVLVEKVAGPESATEFIKLTVPGQEGRSSGGKAPTLGIIGRLGGIGARPERIGLVSDADGALTALACALKLQTTKSRGDALKGDVITATHICTTAPTIPHEPVAFMGSPVDMAEMNRYEVDPAMEAILSIDTTRGNRVINHRGFAITPTVKEGYILRISEDLLDLVEWTTGRPPRVVPITTQDITPYGNGLFHINSILQPATSCRAPVVGVAITAETAVPGCATGAGRETDIEEAARFCLEVAKSFTGGACRFYDEEEFGKLVKLYGPMTVLQTLGAS